MVTYTVESFSAEFDNLAAQTNLDEVIDAECKFIVARNGSLAGIAGINFKNLIPRFEHIIVAPKYQKGKLGAMLMFRAEIYLKELGYKSYNAYILYGKDLMRHYANKFGMIESTRGEKGSWFTKEV